MTPGLLAAIPAALLLSVCLALLVGKGIRMADEAQPDLDPGYVTAPAVDDAAFMAALPVDVCGPMEIERRFWEQMDNEPAHWFMDGAQ